MNTTKQKLTAEDLIKMPYDGFHYELVLGELKKISPAGHEHGEIAMNLGGPLHQFAKKNKLGKVYAAETGFKLTNDPDTVLAPDVAFVKMERAQHIKNIKGFLPGVPDLAVKVLSPSDTDIKTEEKAKKWLEFGTSMVIVLNPLKKTATIYRLNKEILVLSKTDEIDGDDVVPGWKIKVSELFEEK